jgi:methyl-accepting chemotaxis protein
MKKEQNKRTDAVKGINLARSLSRQMLLITIILLLCTAGVSTALGAGLVKGQTTPLRFTVFMVLLLAVMCIVLVFLVRRISGKLATPVVGAAARLMELSSGNLTPFQAQPVNTKEINDLQAAAQSTVNELNAYITNIDETLSRIASSDIGFEVTQDYVGDFAAIKVAMNRIIDALNGSLKSIGTVSGEVYNISQQVSSSAQALAQGATEQASSVEELLATINGISSQVNDTAEHATEANSEADDVRTQITQSNEQMQNLISAMGEISNTTSQVEKIVKLIEDIAFQTNILALNAAVEAARAGAAGKGFAVVADEVKNLATKSAAAAEDTTNLIRNTITAVENGMTISTETADLLAGVVGKVDGMANIIDNISTSAESESASISQVVQGLDQVSTVVQANSATAEESAAVSHELATAAQKLQDMVGAFRLKQ